MSAEILQFPRQEPEPSVPPLGLAPRDIYALTVLCACAAWLICLIGA